MPAETFWRLLQQRMGDSTLNNQIAANVQAHFAQGLQEAIQTWQQDSARALGSVGDAGLASAPWSDMMAQWGKMWPQAERKGPAKDK
jgi:hypothetical protein